MTLPNGQKRGPDHVGPALRRRRAATAATDTAPSGKSATTSFEYLASLRPRASDHRPELADQHDGAHGGHRGRTGRARTFTTTTPGGAEETRVRRAGADGPPAARRPGGGEQARAGDRRLRRRRSRGDAPGRPGDAVRARRRGAAARARRGGRRARRVRLRRGRPADRAPLPGRAHLRLRRRRRRRADVAHAPVHASHVRADGLEQYISAWTPPGGAGAYAAALDADERASRSPTRPGRCARSRPMRRARAGAPSPPRPHRLATRRARTGSRPTSRPPPRRGEVQGLERGDSTACSVTKLTATGLAPAVTTFAHGANLRVTSDLDVPGADHRRSRSRATRTASRPGSGTSHTSATGLTARVGDHRRHGRTEETIDEVADSRRGC